MINLNSSKEEIKKMHIALQESSEYVIADIETTGYSPKKGGRIIEIAAVKFKDGKVHSGFHTYINPEQKIPKKITKLTGITDEMVADKRTIIPVMNDFAKFLGNAVFIAHKKSFDWDTYLKPYLLQAGYAVNNESVCTVELAKVYYPELKSYKLDVVAEHVGVKIEQHHAGWSDVKALSEIVAHMKQLEFAPIEMKHHSENLSLFAEEPIAESTTLETFRIKNVSYWEKKVSSKLMKRLYVTLDVGTVFFDYNTNHWANKDVNKTINFEEIEQRVLRFKNKRALSDYIKQTVSI